MITGMVATTLILEAPLRVVLLRRILEVAMLIMASGMMSGVTKIFPMLAAWMLLLVDQPQLL